MKTEEDKIRNLQNQIFWFTSISWLLVIIGLFILSFGLWKYYYDYEMSLSDLGDFFSGSIASVWSLAGLFFIYVAFLGQKQQMIYQQQDLALNRDDLKLNRAEIKQTNKALKLQSQEMAKQNETTKRQQFENLFFNMIDTHLKIVSDIDITKSGLGKLTGRDVFVTCFNREIRNHQSGSPRISAYRNAYYKYRAEFGHYYRFLYRIISRIDKQEFIPITNFDSTDNPTRDHALYNFEVRYEYSSIVRSLLSDEELELLFLNMLFFKDLKFKSLIEKYCLLKNIPNRQKKIDNKEYDFDQGAIYKNKNSYIIELNKLKQESQINRY